MVLSVVLLLGATAAPIWHIHVVDRAMPPNHNDLISRWIGTQAALQGKDPYSPEVTRAIQIAYYGRPLIPADDMEPQEFAYPAYLAVLISPFARMSPSTASLAFLVIVTPLLAWSFWACLLSLNLPISKGKAALTVFLSLASWPVMWGLRLQQPTMLVAIALFFGLSLLNRNRGFAAGILLALATIKPQLVLPLFLWLLVWACLQRSWKVIASFAITLALLLLSAERMVPGWFGHWRNDVRGYGPHTSLPLETLFGHWLGLVATGLLIAWCGYLLWALRHVPAGSPQFALACALALSLAVSAILTKLAVIYNEVVVLPGCLILVYTKTAEYYANLARRIAIALVIAAYALLYVAILGEGIFGPSDFWDGVPCRNLLLPVLVTIALGAQATLEIRARRAASVASIPHQREAAQ